MSKSITQQFKDWVAQQDPEAEYDYFSPNCPFLQFLTAADFPVATVGTLTWTETTGRRRPIPIPIRNGLSGGMGERTYRALSSRLEGVS